MIRTFLRSLPGLLVLAACGGEKSSVAADDVGGTVIIVQPAEPATLFPPSAYGTSYAMSVVGAVYDRLAEIGPALETTGDAGFQPRLAKSWQWATDSLSIAFALDPNARWHDGPPVRAEDVRHTFAVYSSDSVGSEVRSQLGNIDSVTVRDSLTAVFWFKRRMPQQFLDATYHMYVLPSHLMRTKSMASLATDSTLARHPVGTGRFRFVGWTPAARIEIVADTGNARGRAKLDRVIWTLVPDAGAATVKLFNDEADVYEKLNADYVAQVSRSPRLRIAQNGALEYGYLGLNLEKPATAGTPNQFFSDVRVRRAIGVAIDRERVVRNVFDSLASVALSAAPRSMIPDTLGLKPPAFDPAMARALLDSAGWTDSNGDGVRDRQGVKFAFDIVYPTSSINRQKLAVLIQEQLKAVGIEARPLALEIKTLIGRVNSHDFDAAMLSWMVTPGRVGLRQTWASYGESNCCGYKSTEFDAILDSALTTFDGATSRRRWSAVFQRLIDDMPGVWLYEPNIPMALHRRIRTAPMRADEWYANLADWSIDPSARIERDRTGLGKAR